MASRWYYAVKRSRNPEDVEEGIETVRNLIGKVPMFGICLGHQIFSLASGAKAFKLPFGHRGGNHPVKDLRTGRTDLTSQNHGYAIDIDSLKDTDLELTHIALNDGTCEGFVISNTQSSQCNIIQKHHQVQKIQTTYLMNLSK